MNGCVWIHVTRYGLGEVTISLTQTDQSERKITSVLVVHYCMTKWWIWSESSEVRNQTMTSLPSSSTTSISAFNNYAHTHSNVTMEQALFHVFHIYWRSINDIIMTGLICGGLHTWGEGIRETRDITPC